MKIPAHDLTEGDIIHHEGDTLQVYSRPQYLTRGIVFDALSLEFKETGQTQEVCLPLNGEVEHIDYQSPIAANPAQVA